MEKRPDYFKARHQGYCRKHQSYPGITSLETLGVLGQDSRANGTCMR